MADDRTIPRGEEPTKAFDGPDADEGAGRLGYPGAVRLLRLLSETPPENAEAPGGDEDAEPLPRLPGYTLDRALGSGGGGTVYHGFRDGSDRPLAVKVLRARAGRGDPDDTAVRRAWRELDLTAQLRLPSVPRVIDYGVADAHLFVASEYIDGLPLDRYAEEKRLPRRERVELLARVAEAVHSVHEHGVIHRDLKPSNILVNTHGEPSIIDLGIAVLAQARPDATMTAEGLPIGTPAFMAPEQARGDRGQVSTRTDVYGLGATALLVLTGRTPHDVEGLPPHAAVAKVAREPGRDPRTIDPTLPRGLAAVLGKALEYQPARRYASAAAFAADLRRWLRGEAVEATRPGAWVKAARWAGKHPVWTTTAACLAMFLISIAATMANIWWLNSRPDRIVFSPDRTRAWVEAVNGRKLRMLAGRPSTQVQAMVIRDPSRRGDPRLAAFCASGPTDEGGTDDQLWVAPLADLDSPIWRTTGAGPEFQSPPPSDDLLWALRQRAADEQRPASLDAGRWETRYNIQSFFAADVFPEAPGGPARHELVAIFLHQEDSPSLIVIYDLDGRSLFSAWHLGPVRSAVWLASARLLIAAGDRHGGEWFRRGAAGVPMTQWPRVVFAVEPKLGTHAGWVSDPTDADAQSVVRWYKAVLPPAISALDVRVQAGASAASAKSGVQVHLVGQGDANSDGLIDPASETGGVMLYIDEHGRRMPGTPLVISDVYRALYRSGGKVPPWGDEEQIQLGDLPPLVGYPGPAERKPTAGEPSDSRR